jgi:glycosyltransferase involved in cell wall biosynthesis
LSEEYPPEFARGGIATYTYEMAMAMARKGDEVMVLTRTKEGRNIMRIEAGVICFRLHTEGWKARLPFLWRFENDLLSYLKQSGRFFRRLSKKISWDVIEAAEFRANALFIGNGMHSKLVTRLHTPRKIIQAINHLPEEPEVDRLEKKQVLYSRAISAPSDAVIKRAKELEVIPADSGVVVPNPVSVLPEPRVKKAFRICFIGRLEEGKGIAPFLEALPKVFTEHPKLQVAFYGSIGPFNKEQTLTWKDRAFELVPEEHHDKLIFDFLPREELLPAIAQSMLMVLPSKWDNFPYVLLEAMMMKVPGLVSTNGGMIEMIEPNVDGWVLPDIGSDTIAKALIERLSDPEGLILAGERARDHVLRNYNAQKVAKKMTEFYAGI